MQKNNFVQFQSILFLTFLFQQSTVKPNNSILVEIQDGPSVSRPINVVHQNGNSNLVDIKPNCAQTTGAVSIDLDDELLKIHHWLFFHVRPAENIDEIKASLEKSQWSNSDLKKLANYIKSRATSMNIWSDLDHHLNRDILEQLF